MVKLRRLITVGTVQDLSALNFSTKRFIVALAVAAVVCLTGVAEASIIINEAMINPKAVDDIYGEWIELYNNGIEAIDLSGWILKDAGANSHKISGTLIISAKGYLVLGKNSNSALNGGYIPDYVYSNFTLANPPKTPSDEIILSYENTEISRIDYTASWPILEGSSIGYLGNGDITDPANWLAAPAASRYIYGAGDYGTPGEANFPIAPEPATALLIGSGILMLLSKSVKVSEYQSVRVSEYQSVKVSEYQSVKVKK